ncbi:ribosomal protein S18-alanine N-acetyltransferase [Gorillibacterium sp. CAU 1737]|uniref:ribosomal protein S18-alanine N-acetyltransferase n=1 Tax=Gorillibacterium sp. CAU 1737 TaxID=3140362 RepID=UPI003261C8A3
MKLDDIDAICAIEKEAFTTPWSAGAFYNELTNNHFAHYMVMDAGLTVAGYAGMWLIMDEAHITNIAVKKEFRGMKLGERLMSELMKTASFMGASRITLEVRVTNEIAQNLYRKMGFEAAGVRKGYYTDNQEDALIMWANLEPYVGK